MKEYDVLYIHPSRRLDLPMFNIMPVGIIGIINLIRDKGYSVYGINCGLEKKLNIKFNLNECLKDLKAKVILIDMHWYEHAFGALEAASVCKCVIPGAKIIIGGITSTCFYTEIIENYSQIDFIVRGDSELPMVDLVSAIIYNKEKEIHSIPNISGRLGNIIFNNAQTFVLESFEGLNYIDIDFLNNHNHYYRMTVTDLCKSIKSFWIPIARGCQFNCCYCSGGKDGHRTVFKRENVLIRSKEDVANEVKHLSDIGIDSVNFTHDPYCFGINYWHTLFEILKQKNIKIGIYLELFQLPSKEFIKKLFEVFKAEKSTLVFTPISGNDEVRKSGGKQFDRSDFIEIVNYCKQFECKIVSYFSYNLPEETDETFEETLDAAIKLIRLTPSKLMTVINQPMALDPECPMYANPEKYGITAQFKSFNDYYSYSGIIRNNNNSDNGFFTTKSRNKNIGGMISRWSLTTKFEEVQKFPWHELKLMNEDIAKGALYKYNGSILRFGNAASILITLLSQAVIPKSIEIIAAKVDKKLLENAVFELSSFIQMLKNSANESPYVNNKDLRNDIVLVMLSDFHALAEDLAPPLQALGIGYISSYLKMNGVSVSIIDSHLSGWSASMTAQKIMETSSPIIAFSVQTTQSLGELYKVLKSLDYRGFYPKMVILGGHFATVADKHIFESQLPVDCVVIGEGEESVLEIIKCLKQDEDWRNTAGISYMQKDEYKKNACSKLKKNLDSYPFPIRDYSLKQLAERNGVFSVCSSRGCWGSCSFCVSKRLQKEHGGKPWRARSAENVVEELKLLRQKYNCRYLQFVDDCFLGTGNAGLLRARKIAEGIIENKLDITFSIEVRADSIIKSVPTLMKLKYAGLVGITLGIESGNERALKVFNKQISVNENLKSIKLLKNTGIKTNIGFIFFEPYSTLDDLRQNLIFLTDTRRINPELGFPALFTQLLIFEGTDIKQKIEEDGLLTGDWANGLGFTFKYPETAGAYDIWNKFSQLRLISHKGYFGNHFKLHSFLRCNEFLDIEIMHLILDHTKSLMNAYKRDIILFVNDLYLYWQSKAVRA